MVRCLTLPSKLRLRCVFLNPPYYNDIMLNTFTTLQVSPIGVTVLGAKKCHCKRGASYCATVYRHLYCMNVQLGAQKSVTVRGELLTESL